MMDFFTTMDVTASGLATARARMNIASSNLANAETTRSTEGGPYKRREAVIASEPLEQEAFGDAAAGAEGVAGARLVRVQEDASPPRLEYDPGHPDANADGYVAYPNVNPVEEMVDMITASRAYEAGLTALNTATAMAERALTIGR